MDKNTLESVISELKKRMSSVLSAFTQDVAGFRTGAPSKSMMENFKVEYYGTAMKMVQLANISLSDTTTITIQPWEQSSVDVINRALLSSDLGLVPRIDGNILYVKIPPLSTERREQIVKLLKKRSEEAKVSIRGVRREAIEVLRKLEKESEISQDNLYSSSSHIQNITDTHVNNITEITANKQKEIFQV